MFRSGRLSAPGIAFAIILYGWIVPEVSAAPLTIDRLMQIKHPSSPIPSPDGKYVAFVWDERGVWNLYLVPASGGTGDPEKLTTFPSGQVGEAFWDADGRAIYFPHAGELWKVEVRNGKAASAPASTALRGSNFALSPDRKQLAFVRGARGKGADLVVSTLDGGAANKIAHDNTSIGGLAWSPDGKHILYTGGAKTIRHEQTPEYSGAKIIYTITERAGGSQFVASADGTEPVAIQAPGGFPAAKWVDSGHFVFDRTSKDFKKRSIYVADVSTGSARVIHEDTDDKFWSIPGGTGDAAQPSPDGKWIMFLSDRDSWDHIYLMPSAGGDAVQITKGKFEAWRPTWSPDSKAIAFDANLPDHPGDRHVSLVALNDDPKHATIRTITSGKGTNTAPVWTGDGNSLIYEHTDPQHSADLFAINVKGESKPRRLTDSMGPEFAGNSFVEPEYVHFPGADGQAVPGWLFVPKNLDRSKKHPAIVWIHGDGVNQNYDGWHVQRNYAVYYSFHQYLLQQGYVVFAPDYRGSIGYGRDWREAVYMDVGGKDAQDAWMAGNYLKSLPYVDGDRMGVWGLSYGGFFTLIAATDQPTLFRAAVDVAGVVDYRMYYEDPYHGAWTASRIGTPDENPQVYDKASPISHLDRLQRPLLVLHGTADVNVPYLQSVRLIDSALKLHKGDLVDFMMYPGEFHYFDREPVLRDAWRRVDEFFRKNLMDSRTGATN